MSAKDPGGEFDPETADLARRLSELDFSPESRVRGSLRRRLVERAEEMRRASWRRRWIPVVAPAAALAGLAAALFVGLPGSGPSPEPPSAGDRVLVRGPRVGDEVLVPEQILSEGWDTWEVALGAGPAALDKMTAGDVMETVRGEVVESEEGRAVRWRLGNDVFVLESRRTTLSEIFARSGNRFD
ncbi:MAG: hypothetical protein HY748_07940 [Elusimicrobia bacterium]|nr:hypothetical protein [Elusimicrobiota bacterium]